MVEKEEVLGALHSLSNLPPYIDAICSHYDCIYITLDRHLFFFPYPKFSLNYVLSKF